MMNFSLSTADGIDTPLSLVKFLLPLDHDALSLPATLSLIDSVCHRGALAHEIVAVDDASRDGTAAEARRFAHFMPLWLIQQGRAAGRSAAFRTALEAACRDACDADLLVPIDPRRRPDAGAVLNAIRAAREGWSAVLAATSRPFRPGPAEQPSDEVAVYRAGLIRRHLRSFFETAAAPDAAAITQLDQYLFSAGVTFHRLPAPHSRLVLHPVLGPTGSGIGLGGGRG